jgi:hypothetical protein
MRRKQLRIFFFMKKGKLEAKESMDCRNAGGSEKGDADIGN